MRTISNYTKSAAASDSVYNESTTTLFISGLTGAEVAPLQISGDNVNFVNYYEGGNLVQLSAASASHALVYPGYYRVSVPNTSATASVSVAKPEWDNIISAPWQPNDLNKNLLLWLDAIQANSIIQIESKVAQWNDLSGNNRHVTQTSAAIRPTYSSSTYGSCISYGVGNSLTIALADAPSLSPEKFVIVGLCHAGTVGVSNRYLYHNGFLSSTVGRGQFIQFYVSTKIAMYDAYDSNSSKYVATSDIDASQNALFCMYHNGTSLVKRLGGAQFDSDVTAGTYNPSDGNYRDLGSFNFDGKIYSFIIATYTSALDVQKLEGYICHRYGAQALLAAGHPYKSVAP